jgi:hypothetical protein
VSNKGGLLRIVLGVLGIILSLALFLTLLTSVYTLRQTTVNVADTTDNVTTAVGVTIKAVTLTESLMDSDVANVVSITSTIGTDVPVADNYTAPTLNLTGLTANVTAAQGRTLVTTYEHGILNYFTGLDTVTAIAPSILFLTLLFGSGALVVSGIRKGR